MSMIKITELPSGLRVITDTIDTVESVATGVWIDAGTRHEDLTHNGIAHMTEHMIFKGTKTRSAKDIVEQIEDVGGNVNAYTSRDHTAYHIHLLKDDLPMATDILADIIQNSIMPEEEIERERQVILQEIGMTNDTPDDLVFDLHQETAYPGQALGAPILGTSETVSGMKRETLMDNVKDLYTTKRMVVSAAGKVDHENFVEQVQNAFENCPTAHKDTNLSANYQGGEIRLNKDLEQSHIILGFQGISRHEDEYYHLLAMSTLLGGGMSSRLFQEIREKRGLVYSVFSFQYGYQDDGILGVYAATAPKDLPNLMPALCDELLKLTHTISEEELERAKAQIKANTLMGLESMLRRAGAQAKHLIHFGTEINIDEKIAQIQTIQIQDIENVAKRILSSAPTITALGPLQTLESYDSIKDRLVA